MQTQLIENNLRANATGICMSKRFERNSFLLQFAYLRLRSDECAKEYDQIVEVIKQPIPQRLKRIC